MEKESDESENPPDYWEILKWFKYLLSSIYEQLRNNVLDFLGRLTLFGKDISTIPCFRNSWLYGISGGIGSGLLYFLFTSKTRVATHVGFASTMFVTGTYWFVCRYQFEKQVEELTKIQDYVAKRVLIEGTEMEKLYEAEAVKDVEIATVSNTMK